MVVIAPVINNNNINKVFNKNSSTSSSTVRIGSDETKDGFVLLKPSEAAAKRKNILDWPRNSDNKIEILFPDIDGTIKSFDGNISKNTRKVLEDFQKSGLDLVISTGRTYNEGKELYSKLNLAPNFMITQQGAEIVDPLGNIIYQKKIDKNVAKLIVESFENYRIKQNKDVKLVAYIDGKPHSEQDFMLPYNWEEILVVDSLTKLIDTNNVPTKILLFEPDGSKNESRKINQLISYMNEKLPVGNKFSHTAEPYCEITNPEATKGNALHVILEKMGIEIINCAAIGDSENDLEMLRTVNQGRGLSICMGNALDTVKEVSEYETNHINDEGFSIAINTILENNKRVMQKEIQV